MRIFRRFSNDAVMCSLYNGFIYTVSVRVCSGKQLFDNRERNVLRVGDCLTESDREFHMKGEAREKARLC